MSSLYVICKIADSEYAIPASEVAEMQAYTPVTKVPGAPAYVAGLMQIRQHVVPVIDARLRFGFAPAAPTESSRFIILKFGLRLVGILVDSAREVRKFKPEDFTLAPDILSNQAKGFVKAVTHIQDRIIMAIDGLKVVGEETQNG